MKKIKVVCLAFFITALTFAQKPAKRLQAMPAVQKEKIIKEKYVTTVEEQKIIESLKNKTLTVLGTTDEGMVIETPDGQKITVRHKRPPIYILYPPRDKSKTYKLDTSNISEENKIIKLIGTTADGTPIWENTKGKKCIMEAEKGAIVDYVGHVTLLR
jgi:hypothetical protein